MSEYRSSTKQQSKSDPTGQWDLRAANRDRSKNVQHSPPRKLHPIRLGGRSVFKTADDVRSTLKLSETPKTGTAYELRYDGRAEKFIPKHEGGRKAYCLLTTASLDVLFEMTEFEGCFVSIDSKTANLMTPTAFQPGQPRKYFADERKNNATWKDDGEGHLVDGKGRDFDDVYGRKK